MPRAVVLTQYRRVTDRQTDGQTDGIDVANTALAMRALRALKNGVIWQNSVWPCVKYRAALCACARSRQPGSRNVAVNLLP